MMILLFIVLFQNEWVLCRVFHKNSKGRRMAVENCGASSSSELPSLMEASPNQAEFGESSSHSHVTCFSDPIHPPLNSSHQVVGNNNDSSSHKFSSTFLGQDQQMMMMGYNGWGDHDGDISSIIYNNNDMVHRTSHNQQYYSSASTGGPVHDIGCLWNYST